MSRFLQSPAFVRGRTYRVLRDGDAKLGMYRLLQAGGHIDSEFFPEGMAISNFKSPRAVREAALHAQGRLRARLRQL